MGRPPDVSGDARRRSFHVQHGRDRTPVMKPSTSYLGIAALALCAGTWLAVPARALPVAAPAQPAPALVAVAADCYAVGQEVAAQKGGTLAKASQATRGGQQVCVVVVLVPGKEGERPRRAEIVVPQH